MHVLYINEQSVGRVNLWSRSARLCSHATLRVSHRHVDLVRRQKIMKILIFSSKTQFVDFLKKVSPIDYWYTAALTATGSIIFDVLFATGDPKSRR